MAEPKAPSGAIDPRMVQQLADILLETGLSVSEVEQGGLRIRVARQITATVTAVAPQPDRLPTASLALTDSSEVWCLIKRQGYERQKKRDQ